MIKFLNNELEDINEVVRLVAMRKSLPETISMDHGAKVIEA